MRDLGLLRGDFFFGTSLIEVLKVGAYADGALVFVNKDGIRYPWSVRDEVDKSDLVEFIYFGFDVESFRGM